MIIKTVKDLKEILNKISDDTRISVCNRKESLLTASWLTDAVETLDKKVLVLCYDNKNILLRKGKKWKDV